MALNWTIDIFDFSFQANTFLLLITIHFPFHLPVFYLADFIGLSSPYLPRVGSRNNPNHYTLVGLFNFYWFMLARLIYTSTSPEISVQANTVLMKQLFGQSKHVDDLEPVRVSILHGLIVNDWSEIQVSLLVTHGF